METKDFQTPRPEAEFTSETLNIRSVGVALAISYFAILLWSPIVVPNFLFSAGADFEMHMLRLVFLGALCVVYLIVQFLPFVVYKTRLKAVAIVVATVISPFALLGEIVPALVDFYAQNLWALYVAWGVVGLSVAIMMLIWGYDMSARSTHMQGVANIAVSAIFSGIMFALMFALQKTAVIAITIAMPVMMLVIWSCIQIQEASGSEPIEGDPAPSEPNIALTTLRAVAGRKTTLFVFCYGFVMGVAGSVGTQFAIAHWSVLFIGGATFLAGITMFSLLRLKRIAVDRRFIISFLPVSVLCMFLFSIMQGALQAVPLFIVFFLVNIFNVLNTAFVGDGRYSDPDGMTYDLFNCESRTMDMMGAAVGWATAAIIHFLVDGQLVVYCYFFIVVLLVCAAINFYMPEQSRAIHDENHKRSMDSIMSEWEGVCSLLSDEYELSPREREIFLLLSRGRDRQYIHDLLCIAPSTVRTHTYNIYRKMDIHNQQQLIDVVEARFLEEHSLQSE